MSGSHTRTSATDALDGIEPLAQERARAARLRAGAWPSMSSRARSSRSRGGPGAALPDRLPSRSSSPGQAKQTGEVHRHLRKAFTDDDGRAFELIEQRVVDADLTGTGVGGTETQVHIDLATREFRGYALAQRGSIARSFLGQGAG
jgi:hypothetical protein